LSDWGHAIINYPRAPLKVYLRAPLLFYPGFLADESDASYAKRWSITIVVKGDYESGAGKASV